MSYVKGQKVQYRSIMSGTVLGVVIGTGRDRLGDYVAYRVTSRTNPHYPLGTVDHLSINCPWLSLR